MPRSWGSDDRRQALYSIDADTPLSMLGSTADRQCSLVVGEHHELTLRLSPAGAARLVRLLQAAAV